MTEAGWQVHYFKTIMRTVRIKIWIALLASVCPGSRID
jgi:hypothetical protein